ncbi:MAG: ABC transporter ATP-binding protein [Syntrophobacteria bacterium]|jgi:ABC-type lipoprotein export system ATPase subunit
MIELRDVTKIYHTGPIETLVLKGIDLTIQAGEFCAVIGPSGSGKSTLMHLLGLLDRPSGGTYRLDGLDVTQLTDIQLSQLRNEKMGFVFQNYNLMGRATALENVMLPLVYARNYPNDAKERAFEALDAVGLSHRLNHRPGELSGGECQRVAIARALVNRPEIILADEPTGNLDWKASYEVLDIFQKLNDQGHTFIVVTHEQEIAQHSNRIIELIYGEISSEKQVTVPLRASNQLIGLPEANNGSTTQ